MDRVAAYAGHVAGYVADAGLASAQAYRLLAASVAGQANVLAYRDGFLAAAVGAGLCLLLVALMRPGKAFSLLIVFRARAVTAACRTGG